MNKYFVYALVVTVLSTGVSWTRFLRAAGAGNTSSASTGSGWTSHAGSYGGGYGGGSSGGGGGHK